MGAGTGMRDSAREVAALVDRGAERYALGDVAGAALLWRDALLITPDDFRIRAYLEWANFCLAGVTAAAASPPVSQPRLASEEEALSSALAAGLIIEEEAPPSRSSYPSLADASDSEPTRSRRSLDRPDALGPPFDDAVGVEDRAATSVFGRPWNEITPSGEVEREFISRVETNPNLEPLDVPELTDDVVAALAAAAGVRPRMTLMPPPLVHPAPAAQLPPTVLPPAPPQAEHVVEMVADSADDEHSGDDDSSAGSEIEVIIEMEADEPEGGVPQRSIEQLVATAREAVDRGDFGGAFAAAERLVGAVGGIDAPELIAHTNLLGQIYERELGDPERVVIVAAVPQHLDPRAAFLLSRVDGLLTIEDLHDVSGMPWLEAIRLLALLLREGALAVR